MSILIRLAAAAAFWTSSPATPEPIDATHAACSTPVRVYEAGRVVAGCAEQARAAGLTLIDLDDDWAPYPLAGAASERGQTPPAYRDTYVQLADERFGDDALAAADRHLELYGVEPSLRVVLAAMDDEARHACHDQVEDESLASLANTLRMEEPAGAAARVRDLERRRVRVDMLLRRHGLAAPDQLAALGEGEARALEQYQQAEAVDRAIRAAQAHLVCERLLPAKTRRGVFGSETARALAVYQRRHWIVAAGELDGDTQAALLADSRELDLRLALRVLRQRVADAAGLIEDGSARGEWGTVLGRRLDPAELRFDAGYAPLADGAADLVSPATEAAARALGWHDFASTRDSLRALLDAAPTPIAVRLPRPPAYHGSAMALRAVIHCSGAAREEDGDSQVARPRRPVLELYARTGEREIALVRWPTTLGGWKPERLADGAIVRRHKASDVGPRVWRDLVAAPVWFAPASTPDDELLGVRDGRWTVKEDLVGPGYRSAYGLMMLVHHEQVDHGDHVHMIDHGIRTHGSVSYRSILSGDSHGCHRLYNHQALLLAAFLLRHRDYAVRGPIEETYVRRVAGHGGRRVVARDQRGYLYELTPPVPVDVRAGSVGRACAR